MASHAFGLTSFSVAIMMSASTIAAQLALRSEPAKSQDFVPQATPRRALSVALFVMQILPSPASRAKSDQRRNI